MSIANARVFISEVNTDEDFRRLCNTIGSKEGIVEMLKEVDMQFNEAEFEEAVSMMLVKCQTYEQADSIKQVEWWYSLFKN